MKMSRFQKKIIHQKPKRFKTMQKDNQDAKTEMLELPDKDFKPTMIKCFSKQLQTCLDK